MKKVILKLLCCLIGISLTCPLSAETASLEFDVQTGYRRDDLIWNIGASSGKPNILSELHWNDIEIWNTAVCFKMLTSSNYYARFSADYGQIFSGTNQDSDYLGDHRTKEFSRSKSDASSGKVFDLSFAAGRQFNFFNSRLKLSPLVGYSLNEQHLKMMNGIQIIDTEYDYYGAIEGLNSSYLARWHGPFIGLDLNYQATCKISLNAVLEYHFARFNGFGDWNLRKEFYRDFEQTANGRGIVSSIGALYQFTERLSYGLTFNYDAFKADKGRDRTYAYVLYDGAMRAGVFDCPFNSVKWRSFSILGSAKLQF